jgi:DNA-binding protein Fis
MKIEIDLQAMIDRRENNMQGRGAYKMLLNAVEPAFLTLLLTHVKGNKVAAAKIAGMNPRTLAVKLKKHHLVVVAGIQAQQQ